MNWPEDYVDKVICGDCLEVMKGIPDKSIDLIVNDPPYNIGKADWDKIDNYLEWSGKWIKEAERVLKDNGSFYFFHNNWKQLKELDNWIEDRTAFIFKQFIVWNKFFAGCPNNGYLRGYIESNSKRNYEQMAEYILFYIKQRSTLWDQTGLQMIYSNADCFKSIKEYLRAERRKANITYPEVNRILGTAEGSGQPGHYFSDSQWCLPTAEMYARLQTTGYFQRPYEELRQEYEELRQEYEELRQEYEELRYTFDNQKTHHSVWNYAIVANKKHVTQKPVDLVANIIKHSSNEGDIVLDMFLGSGTTAVAAKQLGRRWIGIEISSDYCHIAEERLVELDRQPDMFMKSNHQGGKKQ